MILTHLDVQVGSIGPTDRADIVDTTEEYYNLSLWFLFFGLKGAEGGARWCVSGVCVLKSCYYRWCDVVAITLTQFSAATFASLLTLRVADDIRQAQF